MLSTVLIIILILLLIGALPTWPYRVGAIISSRKARMTDARYDRRGGELARFRSRNNA
jgi:hypothetical protein